MRARNVKPSLFKNELLAFADPLYTVIFTGLWCLADREGRLPDRAGHIHFDINPGRSLEGTELALVWLALNGFIQRYEVDGKRFIAVVKFTKYQIPYHREPASVIPSPPDIPCLSTGHPVPEPRIPEGPPALLPFFSSSPLSLSPKGRRARKRASRLPDDWKPSEKDVEYARGRGLNPDTTATKFANYWQAKAGATATKLDWSKTWQNWCITESEQRPRGIASPKREIPTEAQIAATRAAAIAANEATAVRLNLPDLRMQK